MNYITTEEYAELKGCTPRYVRQLAKNGKIPVLLNDKAANNRKEYIIPVSALPDTLAVKYNNAMRAKLGLPPIAKTVKKCVDKPVFAVQKKLSEYSADERIEMEIWIKLLKQWQALRNASERKTDIDRLFVAKVKLERPDFSISEDILYRKYAAYREGNLEGLIDKRGGWNKGKSVVPDHILQAFLTFYLDERRLPVSRCYALLGEWVREFHPQDVQLIPSERTLRRQAEALPEAVKALCRYGDKAFSDKYIPYIERMYEDIEANDIWIADNHTFDFITVGENGHQHRLYLTAFIDAKSEILVGWNLTDNPSSTSTLLALRHGIQRFGVPRSIYVDNGSEFLVHDIGGRGHRTRKSWNKDDNPPTILDLLGIDMHNALVHNAKAKPIERTFGTLKNHISRVIETFCGGTILERPESLKWKLKNGIIPEDEQIRQNLSILIDGDYNVADYGGKERRFKGKSRIDVWNNSIKNVTFRKAAEESLSLLLARVTRPQKISRQGVYITIANEKLWYYGDNETILNIGKPVYVRYDPSEISTVRVYDMDTDKYLFTWHLNEEMIIPYLTDDRDAIASAERKRRRNEKAVKEYAKGLTKDIVGAERIDFLAASILKGKRGMERFVPEIPTKFEPILSDTDLREHPELEGIETVEVNLDLMNVNAARRKDY